MFLRGVTRIAIALAVVGALAPRAVQAKAYTLAELVEIARKSNPGVVASGAAAQAMEAQVLEAKRNWFPSGELISFMTAVPKVSCRTPTPDTVTEPDGTVVDRVTGAKPSTYSDRANNCIGTGADPIHHPGIGFLADLRGPWSRTDLKLVQPIWDFGKISAGVAAAEAGVSALREKQAASASDVELNVRKAYWGLKLARELLDALDEGSGYVDTAQKKIDKELADGSGSSTVTDKLRLRTVRAEIDARTLETKRLAELALSGLRTLIGPDAPADLDVDDAPFELQEIMPRSVAFYEERALMNRPEARAL